MTSQDSTAPQRRQSPQTGIHDGLLIDTDVPSAVVFNPEAGVPALLSYAHGQLVILDEVLNRFDKLEPDNALGYALRAVLSPAMDALHIAAQKSEVAHG